MDIVGMGWTPPPTRGPFCLSENYGLYRRYYDTASYILRCTKRAITSFCALWGCGAPADMLKRLNPHKDSH